jgi:hypothetical protein
MQDASKTSRPVQTTMVPWIQKQSPHKQSPPDQHHDCVDGKRDDTSPNPKLSCKDLDMDTS